MGREHGGDWVLEVFRCWGRQRDSPVPLLGALDKTAWHRVQRHICGIDIHILRICTLYKCTHKLLQAVVQIVCPGMSMPGYTWLSCSLRLSEVTQLHSNPTCVMRGDFYEDRELSLYVQVELFAAREFTRRQSGEESFHLLDSIGYFHWSIDLQHHKFCVGKEKALICVLCKWKVINFR